MICISIGNIDFKKALKIAVVSEMIEIRADLCQFSFTQYKQLIAKAGKTIFTVRPGKYNEQERLELFKNACSWGVSYIDAETENTLPFLQHLNELAKDSDCELIISYHNYEITPEMDELTEILQKCYSQGARVAKIATMVQNPDDLKNLFSLYKKSGRKVVLGMGEMGMISRVAAIPLGAEFTFASPGEEFGTAPGQLTAKELQEIYKILKI